MRLFGIWVLFMVVGAGLVFLSSSWSSFSLYGPMFQVHGTTVIHNRRLKENYNPRLKNTQNTGRLDVEDYHPIDPVPSSKASIQSKPIQHGSPLMPYIPRAPPPSSPEHSQPPGMAFQVRGTEVLVHDRKLKENYTPSMKKKWEAGRVDVEDYRPVDPVPNSKSSTTHRPILHKPYTPRAPPPSPLNGSEPPRGSY